MPKEPTKIDNTSELRGFLLDQMVGVSSGHVTHDQARSICNIAQQVHNTLSTEIKMMRAAAETGGTGELPAVSFKK